MKAPVSLPPTEGDGWTFDRKPARETAGEWMRALFLLRPEGD
ncbi:hypothetical protein [Thermobaculum terrenum]|nr:hypothetical protein [Thermobaculum terrenum]